MKLPRFRKLRVYLRSHTFQRNVAASLLGLTLLVVTGATATSSLARVIYRGMVIAYDTPEAGVQVYQDEP